MSNDKLTIIAPTNIEEAEAMADKLAGSALLPKDLQQAREIMITVLIGQELGVSPMAALRGIHVIKGKPALSAELAMALVHRSGLCEYFACVETSDERAVYATKRRGSDHEERRAFTMADAKRAQLLSNPTWGKYPAVMLRRRAQGQLAHDVYPDVLAGCYLEGELEELADAVDVTAVFGGVRVGEYEPPRKPSEPAESTPAEPAPDVLDAEIVDAGQADSAEQPGSGYDDLLARLKAGTADKDDHAMAAEYPQGSPERAELVAAYKAGLTATGGAA